MSLAGRLGRYLARGLILLGSSALCLPWLTVPSAVFTAEEASDG
jgi:hypothetical protein